MTVEMGTSVFTGQNGRGASVVEWDPSRTISPHAIIVGSSGSGKTYRLRYIIKHMIRQNPDVKIHILDVHGDIAPNAGRGSHVEFSETEENGLNPLEVETDPKFGGVRRRINTFVSMINRTTQKLGTRQEAVLRALLNEMYELKGYDARDPRTWDPRTNPLMRGSPKYTGLHPTITDLRILTEWRAKNLLLGAGSKAIKALNEVNKAQKKVYKARKADVEDPATEADLALQKANLKEMMIAYVDSIKTGIELDELLNFDNLETLKVVLERLKALDSSGIFRDSPPRFDARTPLRVYDIKALMEDEQSMFAEVLLERLFVEAKARGQQPGPDTFIVIDEAHKFLSKDQDHIINRMLREIRKFGVGLILVSQSLDHFPEDVIANSAMTMILGLHDLQHGRTEKKLSLKKDKLKFIKPQQTALIQVRNRDTSGSLTNTFVDIKLAS